MDDLIEFVTEVAPNVFPPEVRDRAFLDRVKREVVEIAPYFARIQKQTAANPDHTFFTHINLQIDNAYFWRSSDGELECGLLDWYCPNPTVQCLPSLHLPAFP